MPKKRPSSRCMAIGNQLRTASPKSLAGISHSRASLMTVTVAVYVCCASSPR